MRFDIVAEAPQSIGDLALELAVVRAGIIFANAEAAGFGKGQEQFERQHAARRRPFRIDILALEITENLTA